MKLRIYRLLMLLIMIAIISCFSFSAWGTDVGGIIGSDTTWDLAGSPYIITGNTLVNSGVRLNINPGVEVRFDGFYYLRIEGNIQAKGNYGNEILFTSNLTPQQKSDYYGLNLRQNVGSELSWVIFEFADHGIIFSGGADNKINNCIIRNSRFALILQSSNLLVNNNYIYDCGFVELNSIDSIYFVNNTLDNVGSNDAWAISIVNFSHPTLNHNNFLNSIGYTVKLASQTDGLIDACYNYWGPATTSEMDTKGPNANIEQIYDFYDDPTFGKVDYNNWLNAPNPDAYPDPSVFPNFLPIADCGDDMVVVFNKVTLDGSNSYDPDGSIVAYEWSLQHKDGSIITASGPNPTILDLPSGFFDVHLAVTDNGGLVDTDTMILAAAGPCPISPVPDEDEDGVPDLTDLCPDTFVGEDVDSDGCSLWQFCTAIDTSSKHGCKICNRSDWKNDEPLENKGDCKATKEGLVPSNYLCIPR